MSNDRKAEVFVTFAVGLVVGMTFAIIALGLLGLL